MTFVRQNTKDVRQNIVILAEVPFLFSVRLQWSRPISRGPCDHEIEVHVGNLCGGEYKITRTQLTK